MNVYGSNMAEIARNSIDSLEAELNDKDKRISELEQQHADLEGLLSAANDEIANLKELNEEYRKESEVRS